MALLSPHQAASRFSVPTAWLLAGPAGLLDLLLWCRGGGVMRSLRLLADTPKTSAALLDRSGAGLAKHADDSASRLHGWTAVKRVGLRLTAAEADGRGNGGDADDKGPRG